jgi:hypothetical protein
MSSAFSIIGFEPMTQQLQLEKVWVAGSGPAMESGLGRIAFISNARCNEATDQLPLQQIIMSHFMA